MEAMFLTFFHRVVMNIGKVRYDSLKPELSYGIGDSLPFIKQSSTF